jgi:predicted DsbA family dithiol-disulfide isomerase
MVIEIWSDVVCPFCYVGKRRFENALARFPHADDVEVVWKSFQLNPYVRSDPTISIHEHLAQEKGFDVKTARQLNDRVTRMASEEGLEYHFDKAVVANTFDAHRLVHFAEARGRQDAAEERLFRAYFTEGKNIADHATLVALGAEIGLDGDALAAALANGSYADEVRADIDEARALGITGVPFFVLDRKYAVSGAQDSSLFLQALEQAFAEWRERGSKGELEVA